MRLLTVIFGLLILAATATPLFQPPAAASAAVCPVTGAAARTGIDCPSMPDDASGCPYLKERAGRVSDGCPYSGEAPRPAVKMHGI
jgi:hypothetical protein